jgi:hypothetical protein
MARDLEPRLHEALEELDAYLGDRIAPLLVADSIEVLLDYAPELTAEALRTWAAGQFQARGGDVPVSDLFFHALKKLHILGEHKLLPEERFMSFLVALAGKLVPLCPAGERDRLAASLRFLTEAGDSRTASVDRLHRAAADGARVAPAAGTTAPALRPEEVQSLRRFTLLLDRALPAASAGAAGPPAEFARQLLVLAAAGASSASDLESRVAKLQQVGIGPAVARDLVSTLAESIPDWVVRKDQSVEPFRGGSVEAVRSVVRLAGDRARASERWKELLRAAAEHFNRGAFGRAVTLVDLADRMAREGEVDPRVAEIARGTGHETFDTAAMLQATADPQHRAVLRRLIEFFPAWSVGELLDELFYQPDQKKRRLTLALIEIWGLEAHEPVFERLGTAIATGSRDPNAWWFLRNLVYLLHRLPRPAGSDGRRELELVAPFSALGEHPSFQRETYTFLATLPGGLGSPLLIQRLNEVERALEGTAAPPHELPEMWKLLNALAAALVRCGTPSARRALVEHALALRPRAGDSAARLRELSRVDLAADPEVVGRLLGALRSLLPVKLLGFVVARNEETLKHVVRALSSTSTPEVRRALTEAAERFPDREFGRLAAGGGAEEPEPALAPGMATVEEPVLRPGPARAALAGDLEVFGLPGLLQSLQQSEASGRLLVRDGLGREHAVFELDAGALVGCRCGQLTDEVAFYQVFEIPLPGTFEFARGKTGAVSGGRRLELMGLLMEAMRRYDELQRARALIPDRVTLAAGEARPTAPEGESDGDLVRRLWNLVRSGATAADCEAEAGVDSYRVRQVLAHWLETGALHLAS